MLKERFQDVFESDLITEICKNGKIAHIDEDELIMDIGDPIKYLPIVLHGNIKVMTEDEEGKELLLYYLEMGDSCAITMNCCSGNSKSKVRAISESTAEILFIPNQKVEEWMGKFKGWRTFVLEMYNVRMNEMLEAIDTLAFFNMEERIRKYLRDKVMVTGDKTINTTHLQIANDLHSSRVVISRIMKKLEIDGYIKSKRNSIELVKL
ncbi:MAG: Crp/Fnr family transcriptional regulator [Bacteroidia bacterium]